jgi:chromosomal replication initiation ATPase DnaA
MNAAVQQAQAPAWNEVREQLRGLLGEETYGRWFQTVTASIGEKNGASMLQIAAPNRFQRDWLRDN